MKRILFLFLLAGCFAGCKDEQETKKPKQDESAAKQLNYFTTYEDEKSRQKILKTGCENVLTINKGLEAEYAEWLIKDYNSTCIVPAAGCNFPTITTCPDVVRYDVDLYFANHPKDVKKTALAGWLYDNAKQGKICLEACYETIENAHKADINLGDLLDDVPVEETMTFGQIVNLIKQNDAPGKDSYTNDKYDNYLHFYFDDSNKLQKEKSPIFDEKGGYFSVQLIKSIVNRRKNNANPSDDIVADTVFEFRRAKMGSNEDRVVFSIKNGVGASDFYDFSQIPPNAGGKVYLYAFSPL